MKNFNLAEIKSSPEFQTRLLTPKEILAFSQNAESLDINFHALANDPSIEIIKTETRDGVIMEIEIRQNGKRVFYDDLNFWRKLKAERQEPKNIIH